MTHPDPPPEIAFILERLGSAGFAAYLVGGCVRDVLLGRDPKDYDIAASALPEDVVRLFEKTAPTGLKFGTVTVFSGGLSAEVTTFRAEGRYENHRRPGRLSFGADLHEDLARRDFTVNAMAFHPAAGLIDPFGGRQDLANGIIRAVGDPFARFDEDALRILRAFRFAAELGFALEPNTAAAAAQRMPLVANLSGERIKAELERILTGPRPAEAFALVRLHLLRALGVACERPQAQAPLERLPAFPCARWAGWIHVLGCDAPALFARLRFSARLSGETAQLLAELKTPPPADAAALKRRLRRVSPELFSICLRSAEVLSGVSCAAALETLRRVTENDEPYRVDRLAVGGEDLRRAGIPPGPAYGELLESLLEAVIENPAQNTRELLLQKIGEIRAKKEGT